MTSHPAAERKLAEARTRLAFARPYFSTGIYALRLIVTTEVPSFAVDDYWRVYANPGWIERYDVGCSATALSHELLHVLLDHSGRAKAAGVSFDTLRVWNDEAADPDINDGLCADCQNAKPPLPLLPAEWCSLPSHFDLPDGKVAEWYFAERMKLHRERARAGGGETREDGGAGNGGRGRAGKGTGRGAGAVESAPSFGCGSGATGVPAPWEVGSPESSGIDGLDDGDVWAVRRGVAADLKSHVAMKGRGSVPGGLLEWADDLLRPRRIPWERACANAVRRATQTAAGAVRHSYARPSRRQHAYGAVVMPAYRRPVPNIALVSDTSLSMNERQRALARGVVEAACRCLAVPLRVIDVDAAVHRDVVVSSGRMTSRAGGGGTDMRVGIEQAFRRPRPADCVVVCTDCDTPWPSVKPAGVVVVLAIGASREAIAAIPPWMTVIEVEEA